MSQRHEALSECLRQWRREEKERNQHRRKTPSWDVPPTQSWRGWYDQILPTTEGQHRIGPWAPDLPRYKQERKTWIIITTRNIWGVRTGDTELRVGPPLKVELNERAETLFDFQIQTVMMVTNQWTLIVEEQQRTAAGTETSAKKNTRNWRNTKEELEAAWQVQAAVVGVVIGPLGTVTPPIPHLERWLQGPEPTTPPPLGMGGGGGRERVFNYIYINSFGFSINVLLLLLLLFTVNSERLEPKTCELCFSFSLFKAPAAADSVWTWW